VFAAHNHAFLFIAGSLIAVSPNGYLTASWRSGRSSISHGRRARYTADDGSASPRAALVLGVAYAVLFALVTIGLVIAAVLLS
jgi:hypothetical protein